MFQYAAGLALADRLAMPFAYDDSAFARYPLRPFALNDWCISARPASELERVRVAGSGHIIEEHGSVFVPALLAAHGATYLKGYWQSEQYFSKLRPRLLREFSPSCALTKQDLEICQLMQHSLSISLHVRRGDYIANAHTNSFHGVMGLDYYREGRARILRGVSPDEHRNEPMFFIFSDDPDWCETAFDWIEQKVIVRHNPPERGFMDIHLMRQCKHHIIANSSFSWWGAWLCENENQIVIAPKAWFQTETAESSHIVPLRWTRL
jgi:hypothetical protein